MRYPFKPSFFFQAEDGIRDQLVTGVQTCALPIYLSFSLEVGPPEWWQPATAMTMTAANAANITKNLGLNGYLI